MIPSITKSVQGGRNLKGIVGLDTRNARALVSFSFPGNTFGFVDYVRVDNTYNSANPRNRKSKNPKITDFPTCSLLLHSPYNSLPIFTHSFFLAFSSLSFNPVFFFFLKLL